jgi:hypothetical protein
MELKGLHLNASAFDQKLSLTELGFIFTIQKLT